MSIEIRPLGATCNLRCEYCYEQAERDISATHKYHREAILEAANAVSGHFSIFGGEPLVLPLHHLEELLKLSCTKHGQSGIQTNGSLITDEHIEAFIRWKTHVGISIDGPGELNDIRWAGTLEATRNATAKTEANIRKLVELSKTHPHLKPSFIVTTHAGNLGADKFPRFVTWLRELDSMGITYVNLHVMEMDFNAQKWYLPTEEYAARWIDLWELEKTFRGLRFTTFAEILSGLQGSDKHTVCIWRQCDPWNTDSVRGIEYDGSPSFCGRSLKDGKQWLPAEGDGAPDYETRRWRNFPATRHYERQMALYTTPQEVGGCQGCQWWLTCQGNCPGSATKDWRYRSDNCAFWKILFAHGEKILRAQGITPFTDWRERMEIEEKVWRTWAAGQRPEWVNIAAQVRGTAPAGSSCTSGQKGQHRDHNDHTNLVNGRKQGHGDEHGDAHGDSEHYDDKFVPQNHLDEHGDAHGDEHGDSPHGDHDDV